VKKLHHGTTQRWAQDILENGPDPHFQVPGDPDKHPRGFFCALPEGPFPLGSPEQYARNTAKLFPETGPPVILEITIPDELWPELVGQLGTEEDDKGQNHGGEIWFGIDFWETGKDFGSKKLSEFWPQFEKRILPLEDSEK
jgi:hypothetical protein